MTIGGVSQPILQNSKRQQEPIDSRVQQTDTKKEKLQLDDEFRNAGREVIRDKSASNKSTNNKLDKQSENQVNNGRIRKNNEVNVENKTQADIQKDFQSKFKNPEGYLLDTYA